jgi:hypothetical protein
MTIHLDSDNPKPIEQKVRELILKKLYIKVDKEQIFINKDLFFEGILVDIIALATSDYDIDTALSLLLKVQPEYKTVPDVKKKLLEEALEFFENEVDAYRAYLDGLENNVPDDEIYTDVLLVLNSEREILEKRLHELMMESLGRKLSEEDAKSVNSTRDGLLDVFANQVKLLASYDNIEDTVNAAIDEFADYPKKHLVTRESIRNEYLRFAPLVKDETSAYKMALSLEEQDAEIPMILAFVRQMLHLEEDE